MTEPSAADRVAALRSSTADTPVRHAQAAKILTAGGAISLVLGLVASLAHASQEKEQKDDAAREAAARQLANATTTTSLIVLSAPPTVPATPATDTAGSAIVEEIVVPVPTPAPTPAPAPRPVTTSGQPAPPPAATTKTSG